MIMEINKLVSFLGIMKICFYILSILVILLHIGFSYSWN